MPNLKLASMLAKVQKLFKSFWGWLFGFLALFPLWRIIYGAIDAVGNAKMITDSLPSIGCFLVWAWGYINTTPGSLVVMVIGFALIALQLHRQERRSISQAITTTDSAGEQLQTEKVGIVSPSDDELVDLYERVRGYVFPANSEVQVLVLARETWYSQGKANVDGTTWSIKCQFGSRDKPTTGSFKIIAVCGNQLTERTYKDLPTDVTLSNVVSVQRRLEPEASRLEAELAELKKQLTSRSLEKERLETALSNEKYTGGLLKTRFESQGKELVELRDQLAIETHRMTKEIEDLRSEITQLNGYVRHAEKYRALRETADTQRRSIDGHVKLEKVTLGDLTLVSQPGHPRSVRFGLYVTNNSMWEISLKNELGGSIRFEGTELEEHKKVINSVTNLPVGHTGCLTIEQRLSLSDVQIISEARYAIQVSYFHFENLIVTIEGGQRATLDIDEKPLHMNSAKLLAFPVTLEERGQRIRAFAEIRGSCVQLHEPLINNGPLPKEPVEIWQNRSLETLKNIFNNGAADTLWRKITHGVPFPRSDVSSQRDWLQGCIVVLGGLLADETGEYIRNRDKD